MPPLTASPARELLILLTRRLPMPFGHHKLPSSSRYFLQLLSDQTPERGWMNHHRGCRWCFVLLCVWYGGMGKWQAQVVVCFCGVRRGVWSVWLWYGGMEGRNGKNMLHVYGRPKVWYKASKIYVMYVWQCVCKGFFGKEIQINVHSGMTTLPLQRQGYGTTPCVRAVLRHGRGGGDSGKIWCY